MHELSLCRSLVARAAEIARAHGGRVRQVRLAVGPLSGAVPALMRDAFPLAATGTAAEGAVLVIEERPIRVRCRACAAESETQPNRLVCGACGSRQTELISGDELLLVDLDVETPEAANV